MVLSSVGHSQLARVIVPVCFQGSELKKEDLGSEGIYNHNQTS